ncbi:MAG: hypothetical protein J7M25_01135 [Deltaproteobacteria bacterium]|nr:hypothetical protein [Deltaproteobacteria bacterium]
MADTLAWISAGPRTKITAARAKVNAVYSVLSVSAKRIIVAAGTTGESKSLQLGSLDIKGKVLLFDLGYFRYPGVRDIVRQKGSFVSRMKNKANPVIIADHHQGPGRTRDWWGSG